MSDPIRMAPQDVSAFLRRYRLAGGRLRRVRVLYPKAKEVTVEFHLTVHEATKNAAEAKAVRLVLRLEGVEEYRFQMRPGQPKVRISDARIGYLNGLFLVNLDAWTLEPGEQPKLHDFRASEVYAGGRELFWSEVGRKPKTPDKPNPSPPPPPRGEGR
ncbi:MAG: hypothetical protein K8U57_25485 [Planctomycetes bacterium]|nr:hypothetical protein [Planctomycetota bacterium]